ncbi:MAG: helix-turn-helix domain-containing protein [Candidatus Limnocylindria bacterium]
MRVGSLARAVRHRLGWTQKQLANRAGVSQKLVSLFECGRLEELTVRSARRIGQTLEIGLPFAPRWRGGDGVRLLDSDHAALVNRVVATLRTDGWEVIVEYTFNHYGDRGSVDVIAWHAGERSLFIIEVKSRLLDMQETLAALGRKTRVVPGLLARERGWHPAYLGVALVMSSLTANRAAVARNGATFDATFPQRTVDARRWVRRPSGPLAALWFVSSSNGITGTRAPGSRKRVRRSSSRSASRAVSA